MRRLIPYVAFGLTLFALGLLVLIPLLRCTPTHPAAPARFIEEVPMPHHTKIYPIPRRDKKQTAPAPKEVRR